MHCQFLQRSVCTASSYRGLSALPVLTEVCLYRQFLERSVCTASSYRGLSVPPVLREVCLQCNFLHRSFCTASSYKVLQVSPDPLPLHVLLSKQTFAPFVLSVIILCIHFSTLYDL